MVLPCDLARLVINGPESAAVRTCTALHSAVSLRVRIGVREIENTEGFGRTHIEQASLRIEAWRWPVCCTTRIRRNQDTVGSRLLGRIWDRLTLAVDPQGPVHCFDHGRSGQILAVRTVEQEEVAVPIGLRKHFPCLPIKF